MNLKDLIGFKNRRFGFYVSIALSVLLLLTGIVYAINAQTKFYSEHALLPTNIAVIVLLIVGAFVSAGLLVFKKTAVIAPFVGLVAILTAFCLHVEDVYLFIMNCFVDIDFHPEDFWAAEFFSIMVLMVITLVVSIVTCFLPQIKTEEKHCCCGCCEEAEKEVVDHE